MQYKFTKRAEKALQIADNLAIQFGHQYIGTEHLLYGLIKEGEGVASKVLEMQDISTEKINKKIEEILGILESKEIKTLGFTPRTKRVIENAFKEAKKINSEYIGTEQLLVGIMQEPDSVAVQILMELNVNPQIIYSEIAKVVNEEELIQVDNLSKNTSGYTRKEELVWIKTNQLQRLIRTGRTGHWLNHSKEHCLIGIKGNPKLNRNLDCDVLVSEVRETSRKPDEIYELIERMKPGGRKLELFARAHNRRQGWISLGNQLPGVYFVEKEIIQRFNETYPNDKLDEATMEKNKIMSTVVKEIENKEKGNEEKENNNNNNFDEEKNLKNQVEY